MVKELERAEISAPEKVAEGQIEEQQAASLPITLAEKIAQAVAADMECHVDDTPTSPSAVPRSRGRSKIARLGTVINKIPYV